MKNNFLLILFALILAGCKAQTSILPAEVPTETQAPVATASPMPTDIPLPSSTPLPTETPLPTPTSTPALPVGLGTPLPMPGQPISAENAAGMRLLGVYSGNPIGTNVISANGKRAIFANTEGIEVFDLEQQQLIKKLNASMHYDRYEESRGWISVSADGSVIGLVTQDSLDVLTSDGKTLYSLPSRPNEDYPSLTLMDGIGISPDGKLAAVVECAAGEYDGCPFQVVRIDTGEIVYTWDQKMLNLHGATPVFSPDGSILATWFDSTLWFWNTSDWSPVVNFLLDERQGWAYSPDSKQVALGTGKVQIWDLAERKLVREMAPISFDALYPFYSPDGQWLAAANWRGNVAVWNTADGSLFEETTLQTTKVTQMRLVNGKAEMIILPQHDINLWDGSVGSNGFQFVEKDDQPALAILQYNQGCLVMLNGQAECQTGEYMLLSSTGNFLSGTNLENNIEFHSGLDGSGDLAASFYWSGFDLRPAGIDQENGFLFYTSWIGLNSANGLVIDTAKGTTIKTWNGGWLSRINYSPDGKYAAFVMNHNPKYEFILFDRVNRLPIFNKTYTYGLASAGVVFSPDSQIMALIIGDPVKKTYVIELMNITSPYKTTPLEIDLPESVTPRSRAFSPDGALLAVGLSDGRILLIQPADGSVITEWPAYQNPASELAFSQDGTLIASADDAGYIKIWGIWQ
ncbi:MAG: hypothetical protein CVU39_21515 [Chloroflexi bacterium HGW-Chloroflexi-10]|nr:MAG: hypothetical protein CVU39_21515 [Chloroflexi bacterium HGW-Chloroflexi-10]